MRVALYARVSTDRQERERTIDSQVDAIRTRATSEGWRVVMTCLDEGHSGAHLDRPALDRVRDAAAARIIDAVVVLCPDRLARNYVHQMIVLEELARFSVQVVFCEGGVADDPQGRLLVQIQAAVAEFERTKIIERNRRGKVFRARQGAVVSGHVPYGYRKLPASDGLPPRLEICEEEASVVRHIFHLHVHDGLSVRQLAIRLTESGIPSPKGKRIWGTSTLDRLLRQEAYAGTFFYNRRIYLPREARIDRHAPGHRPITQTRPRSEWIGVAVPPIVDLETWTRSQSLHQLNARFSPRHVGAEKYLLRYLVRCAECGQARAAGGKVHPNGREDRYYRCDAVFPMYLREEKLRCSQPSSRADELDELVWGEVVRHLRHPELIARACAPGLDAAAGDGGAKGAERQLAELRAQLSRLLDAYQAGAITLDALQTRERPLVDRIAELEHRLASNQLTATKREDAERRIEDFAREVAGRLDTMKFTDRQELVRAVLEKVVVTKNRVELLFKIPLPPGPQFSRDSPSDSGRLRSKGLAQRIVGEPQTGRHPPALGGVDLLAEQLLEHLGHGQVLLVEPVRQPLGRRREAEVGEVATQPLVGGRLAGKGFIAPSGRSRSADGARPRHRRP
jgi:site-specific DNA recombinase